MTTVSPYLTQIKLNQLTDRHVHLRVPSRTYDLTDGWVGTVTGDQRSWDVTDGVVGVLGRALIAVAGKVQDFNTADDIGTCGER